MKNIILGIAILLAVAAVVYFYVVEGFVAIDPAAAAGDAGAVCMAQTTCSGCLGNPKCGWCGDSQACIPRMSTYRLIPSWLTNANKDCSATKFVYRMQSCPDIKCSTLTNCADCVGSAAKCGWCPDSNTCVSPDVSGNPVVPSGGTCAKASFIKNGGTCPALDCTKITDCATCAGTATCGYCKDSKTCVTLDRYGMPPPMTCTQSNIASGPFQCPGAAPTLTLPPPVSDSSADSSASKVDMAGIQDNSAAGGALDTSGSPSPSYSMNTAPGVARTIGSSSVPASAANPTGLGPAPLESYVKMLVNSQLVAQGIPTNEPFQIKEADAIPNATDYMKKVFRGVFH